MAMAIENYLLGKQQEAVLVVKPSSLKSSKAAHTTTKTIGTKKTKSVFASKAKYKQLMEEKKARAAERRAERAAEKARKEKEAQAANAEKTNSN